MNVNKGLRVFSKLTCWATLFLIFAGAMVNSTGSGLAVPDWPLSYGMLFPPMIGGVFYEHGHRMIASLVGFMMLILAVWIFFKDERKWVKILGFIGLASVIIQGILGGITVLYYLPTPISVAHGVLAQTFFIITIIIAYYLSNEHKTINETTPSIIIKWAVIFMICIFIQLVLGAVMRHTGSGLAVYDFPTIAGQWMPNFDNKMMAQINLWRFDNDFDLVSLEQVIYHVAHRVGAFFVVLTAIILNIVCVTAQTKNTKILQTIIFVDILLLTQVILGILTIFTLKSPIITSIHVLVGASILGISCLIILRSAPSKFKDFYTCLISK